MKKSDLKTGMIVTTSNDEKYIVLLDCDIDRVKNQTLVRIDNDGMFTGGWNNFAATNDDLTDRHMKDYDIVKVQRGILNQHNELETLWERDEDNSTELTVNQISEKLGYKVKVVGELK